MDNETLSGLRNPSPSLRMVRTHSTTLGQAAPKIALERLANGSTRPELYVQGLLTARGEKVPREFGSLCSLRIPSQESGGEAPLAAEELNAAVRLSRGLDAGAEASGNLF